MLMATLLVSNWLLRFQIHTDTSNVTIRVILAQNSISKVYQLIAYANQLLNHVKYNYSITK